MSIISEKSEQKKEEYKSTLEKCSNCGLCKVNCPTFKSTFNESIGPRGRMFVAKKNILDEVFYKCSICGACKIKCPAGVEIEQEIIRMREKMVKTGKGLKGNEIMIKNVRESGNPYGKVEKGKIPKELYCC
jgi:Fe-S oxidoreductase